LTAYQILQTYIKDEKVFRIKDKHQIIFGIRYVNKLIDLKKHKVVRMRNKTTFETSCFSKVERLTNGEINNLFKRQSNIKSEKLTDENVQHMCRVLVLKLLVSLFLPNNESNLSFNLCSAIAIENS
jgi:hypothetical protein